MYVAVELKTMTDGTMTVSTYKKDTRDEAEKAYHSILSVAATSNAAEHYAVILNSEGVTLKRDGYKHSNVVPEVENGGE